jgi:hypothetical protein
MFMGGTGGVIYVCRDQAVQKWPVHMGDSIAEVRKGPLARHHVRTKEAGSLTDFGQPNRDAKTEDLGSYIAISLHDLGSCTA